MDEFHICMVLVGRCCFLSCQPCIAFTRQSLLEISSLARSWLVFAGLQMKEKLGTLWTSGVLEEMKGRGNEQPKRGWVQALSVIPSDIFIAINV